MLDARCWILDARYSILDAGYSMLDAGKERLSAFGTQHLAKSHLVVAKKVKIRAQRTRL